MLRVPTILFLAVLFVGCASVPPPSGPRFSELEVTSPSHATAYFIRAAHPLGSAVWPQLLINGQHAANLTNGTYTTVKLPPGTYTIKTRTDPRFFASKDWPSETTIAVEPGRRYFIDLYREIRNSRGFVIAGSTFISTNDMEATKHELRQLTEAAAIDLLQPLQFDKALLSVLTPASPSR